MIQNGPQEQTNEEVVCIRQPTLISAPQQILDLLQKDAFYQQYKNAQNKKFKLFFHRGIGQEPDLRQQQFILNLIKEDPLADSFQVYDKQTHVKRINQFSEKLPWIKPHFAVKCNPRPEFLHTFVEVNRDFGFDVASLDEIYTVTNYLQTKPDNIVYCNSVRSELDVLYAKAMNLKLLNADTIEEIVKLKLLSDQSVQQSSLAELQSIVIKLEKMVKLRRILNKQSLTLDDLTYLNLMAGHPINLSDCLNNAEELEKLILLSKQELVALEQELKGFVTLTQECSNFPFQILWRIQCVPDPKIVREKNNTHMINFGDKFGDVVYEGREQEIEDKFMVIKELGVDIRGIHFHSGSCFDGSKNFDYSIEMAKKVMKVGRECGHTMNIMDIGGGFPGHELTDKLVNTLQSCRPGIYSKMNDEEMTDYQVYAEPGRHFATQCYYGLVRIIGKKKRDNGYVYEINDGLYNMLSPVWQDSFKLGGDQFYSGLNSDGTHIDVTQIPKRPCTIFGQTCDSTDKVVPFEHDDLPIMLPNDLEIGDWICIGGLGAYSASVNTQFNSMRALTKIYIMNIAQESESNQSSNF